MAGFKGFGGGMNMQQMMKQAQKMQEQMLKAQEELEDTELTGEAGGGIVTVTMNGKKRMLGVSVKPEAVDPDDVEMLEDLILAAYNDAYERAGELEQEKLPMGGMGF
ncbi:MAG: YbaB/EbfC family nucleoid-associated protein [Clostridiales bacterium]|jgi:DNA-binding YbaB/EbfC family protein|nr:YbaB/EbfC family nucleoid-associated protein [Clostridiales bacterium]